MVQTPDILMSVYVWLFSEKRPRIWEVAQDVETQRTGGDTDESIEGAAIGSPRGAVPGVHARIHARPWSHQGGDVMRPKRKWIFEVIWRRWMARQIAFVMWWKTKRQYDWARDVLLPHLLYLYRYIKDFWIILYAHAHTHLNLAASNGFFCLRSFVASRLPRLLCGLQSTFRGPGCDYRL